jgi:CCR4-NOT transcription complex subunit 6
MVVAGDLNSTPGSAPHTLMLERRVDLGHRDLVIDPLNLFTGQNTPNKLVHSLNLRSAYSAAYMSSRPSPDLSALRLQLDDKFHEPKYTNITHDFKETLDYIVFSFPELRPTALLEIPSLQELLGDVEIGGLPNCRWPSDHIALMAEFQFAFADEEER